MKTIFSSTSLQDTPSLHQTLLNMQGFELVKLRGPLKEVVILDVMQGIVGIVSAYD